MWFRASEFSVRETRSWIGSWGVSLETDGFAVSEGKLA